MSGSSERWLPIESNPTVMNSFLRYLVIYHYVFSLKNLILLLIIQTGHNGMANDSIKLFILFEN